MSRVPEPMDRTALEDKIRDAMCPLHPGCGAHDASVERVMAILEPVLSKLEDQLYSCWESAMGEDL